MKRILCLSGGGAKGIAQLMVLVKLEEEYGKPLHEVYDLIVGTSVGAINASIIASGAISMKDLADVYKSMLKRVFTKRGFFKKPLYDRDNFKDAWNDIVGSDFTVGDVKTNLIITSVDLVTDTTRFFKSWHDDDKNDKLDDVVCRSFAAPLYFGHIADAVRRMVFSDGGIGYANLPLNECKTQAESFGWYDTEDKEVLVDAIGCLYDGKTQSYNEVAKQRWLGDVLDYMNPKEGGMAKAQSRVDQIRQMQYINGFNNNIKFRYWDSPAKGKKLKLDGIKYLDYYEDLGIAMSKAPQIDLT